MPPKKRRPRDIIMSPNEWRAARKRAIALYDHECVLCHKELDPNAKPWTHNSIEVDHRVALARGGHPVAIENLQLLCHPCNRKKGTKLESDYEGLDLKAPFPISQNW